MFQEHYGINSSAIMIIDPIPYRNILDGLGCAVCHSHLCVGSKTLSNTKGYK
jgi:hypothetical protein